MKSFIRTALLAAAVAVIGYSHADAQTRIGVVNSETIIEQMPEFKTIDAQVKALQKAYQDTVQMAKSNFDQQVQQFQQQQGVMDATAKSKEEERLLGLQQQILGYNEAHLGAQGTVARKQAELVAPVRERVIAAIKAVAQQEKLDAVMEQGGFLYVDTKLDITFKVLDYLRRG